MRRFSKFAPPPPNIYGDLICPCLTCLFDIQLVLVTRFVCVVLLLSAPSLQNHRSRVIAKDLHVVSVVGSTDHFFPFHDMEHLVVARFASSVVRPLSDELQLQMISDLGLSSIFRRAPLSDRRR